MSSGITIAKPIDTSQRMETTCINNVNFFIFFDGTNNNMVQQAYYHTYKQKGNNKEESEIKNDIDSILKIKQELERVYIELNIISSSIYSAQGQDFGELSITQEQEIKYKQKKNEFIHTVNKVNTEYEKNGRITFCSIDDNHTGLDDETRDIDKKLEYAKNTLNGQICPSITGAWSAYENAKKQISEILEKLQAKNADISLKTMNSDSVQGYSNIAILHSLADVNRINKDDKSLNYKLYIEGTGANDIAHTDGVKNEGNINGLGFGLGKTGVTALVSKAMKYVYEYISINKSHLNVDTKYKFYLFGFSRGATCARLFAHTVSRDLDKATLPREGEFGEDTSKVQLIYRKYNDDNKVKSKIPFKNNSTKRIPFMETNFVKGLTINRENVSVEFLGIYDTVSSIGFLKQKDGWTNSLSWGYRIFPWNNYNGNFHYQNTYDYGLYSPYNKRVKYTCHICAADEFRENFALVSIGKIGEKNEMPRGCEYIIPGCHSDVGGGYVSGTQMDHVLYKFKPRKFEHLLKSNKLFEMSGFPYLRLLKERAKLIVGSPFDANADKNELNSETLDKLGWINDYKKKNDSKKDNNSNAKKLNKEGKPYTLRYAEWPNEIKFKRFSNGGYSNIPLGMMIKSYWMSQKDTNVRSLFGDNITEDANFTCDIIAQLTSSNYRIPEELVTIGNQMLNCVNAEKTLNKRIWICPDGGYSGESYRKLRLKFLHFTSSCEIWHFRSPVRKKDYHGISKEHIKSNGEIEVKNQDKEGVFGTQLEINPANFGNNPNYDNDSIICRIVYSGAKEIYKNHKSDVRYTYDLHIDKTYYVDS